MAPEMVLGMENKAMDDTGDLSGLPPIMLVYETMLRALGAGLDVMFPKTDVRFRAMTSARAEYLTLVKASRMLCLLNQTVTTA